VERQASKELRNLSAEVRLSCGGRKEAVEGTASFVTQSAPPIFPPRTVVRADLPATVLAFFPTTRGTDSRDGVNL